MAVADEGNTTAPSRVRIASSSFRYEDRRFDEFYEETSSRMCADLCRA